jgi:hypothetical protein
MAQNEAIHIEWKQLVPHSTRILFTSIGNDKG